MVELNEKQKKNLKDYFNKLCPTYKKSEEFEEHKNVVLDRISYFRRELPKKIDDISEIDLVEILSNTWAISRTWGNVQSRAQKIIADNGIKKIKEAFKILLDTSIPPHKRYGKVLKMIKGLGPASITEILAYIHPHKCSIWNIKAQKALDILNISIINTKKDKLTPQEYKTYNKLVKTIQEELNFQKSKMEDIGLFLTDFFFFELNQQGAKPEKPKDNGFDHDEIKDLTQDIGSMLGFEADTEVQVAHGARVDVVWSARIGNLGIINYVLEVHKAGSIDSLLMNLQKAKSNPTVQKVVAISDETQLEKIKRESEGLPEEFRRDLTFWPVENVMKVHENLELAMKTIDNLNLTPEPFK